MSRNVSRDVKDMSDLEVFEEIRVLFWAGQPPMRDISDRIAVLFDKIGNILSKEGERGCGGCCTCTATPEECPSARMDRS